MQLSHTSASMSACFDDPNLVSAAGLVPLVGLAGGAGLGESAQQWLSVPTDKGANAGGKVLALVAGMCAGADSIEDMRLLRHGGMKKVFACCYAPSTLGSFLRAFTFGHVRQLDAVASRFLTALAARSPILPAGRLALVDIDDTIIEVHGYAKQGASFGYTGVRGLNAIIATVSTAGSAPVIAAQRLRKGSANSARGAASLVTTAVAGARASSNGRPVLLRADSAYYNRAVITAAASAGAQVSITVQMRGPVKQAIAAIGADAWTPITYTRAVFDETSRSWISGAQVAEIEFSAFAQRPDRGSQFRGRLVVRRVPELNREPGQDGLFDVWRYHAFFTTSTLDVVAADKTHRGHAIIEQVFADLKDGPLAHMPSASYAANSAWLVLAAMAFNLTRAAATLSGTRLGKATTATIRRTLINVPVRIARSARRLHLHLPANWPWATEWQQLFTTCADPP